MSVRKPTRKLKLHDLVLELESRMEGGDSLSEVLLPPSAWEELVETAQEEAEATLDTSPLEEAKTRVVVLEAALERKQAQYDELATQAKALEAKLDAPGRRKLLVVDVPAVST